MEFTATMVFVFEKNIESESDEHQEDYFYFPHKLSNLIMIKDIVMLTSIV